MKYNNNQFINRQKQTIIQILVKPKEEIFMESKILEILQSLQDGQKRMEIRLDSMENKMGLMEN